jgi:hypothetical protein
LEVVIVPLNFMVLKGKLLIFSMQQSIGEDVESHSKCLLSGFWGVLVNLWISPAIADIGLVCVEEN